jgi:hypothetical protein
MVIVHSKPPQNNIYLKDFMLLAEIKTEGKTHRGVDKVCYELLSDSGECSVSAIPGA